MSRALGAALVLAALGGFALVLWVLVEAAVAPASLSVVLLLLPPAFLLLAGLRLLGVERRPPARADEAPRPVSVSRVPDGPVHACMRCGHPRMLPAPLGADALFSEWICERCRFRGQPLQFETGDAWAAFVRGLHEQREN